MPMNGALRRQPSSENLPLLFSIQRTLTLHSELPPAFQSCANKLGEAAPDAEVIIAFNERTSAGMEIAAASPEALLEKFRNKDIRIGAYPCGFAVEREALSVQTLRGGAHCIEAPISDERKMVGAISMRLSSSASDALVARIAELVQWTAFLVEESLGLRKALQARSMDSAEILDAPFSCPPSPLPREEISYHGMIGSSARMREVYTLISQVAGTDATVLITGESGTGKELAARAIHDCSTKSGGPFIAVNCSALPETIIESELFGHEKGSFTGAIASRQGRFEMARDGTLFIDEIGDLSPAVQVKLLRILQERSFERVGGNKTIRTNARIITATHRNLEAEVKKGTFREDLYFRLNVFPVHIPPLRERGADILLLADHFAGAFGNDSGRKIKRISSPALDLLMIYHWPGNVRELENCISRAAIVSTDGVIHSYNLPPSLQSASSTGTEPTSTFDSAIARVEKELLVEALKIERGNSALAAKRLGVTERRFRLALQKYKLDYRAFRTRM